jgi:prepilin-type N-terminal cleavage/methylation domain
MGIRAIIKKRFNPSGFTMIEMIAAMVLVSILVPGISVIVRGSLMNVAFTNMAVLANMEANYAQRKL